MHIEVKCPNSDQAAPALWDLHAKVTRPGGHAPGHRGRERWAGDLTLQFAFGELRGLAYSGAEQSMGHSGPRMRMPMVGAASLRLATPRHYVVCIDATGNRSQEAARKSARFETLCGSVRTDAV